MTQLLVHFLRKIAKILLNPKYFTTFAVANQKFADILKSVYYGVPTILSSGVSLVLVLVS